MSRDDIDSNIQILNGRIVSNNTTIQKLISMIEKLNAENARLTNRMETMMQRLLVNAPQTRQPTRVNSTEPNLPDTTEDYVTSILFYYPQTQEDVPVIPTEEEIERGTTNLFFRNIDSPLNSSCPICLESFSPGTQVTQINSCRHIFKPLELSRWFTSKSFCPVCRYDIRDPPSTTSRPIERDRGINETRTEFLDNLGTITTDLLTTVATDLLRPNQNSRTLRRQSDLFDTIFNRFVNR